MMGGEALAESFAVLESFAEPVFHLALMPPDSTNGDTAVKNKLPYPIKDRKPYDLNPPRGGFDLAEPPAIKNKYELDPNTNSYNYSSKIGGMDYRLPASISVKDQLQNENQRQNQQYFKQRSQANNFVSGSGIIPPLRVGPKIFERIFGSGVIDIRPRGTAELIFAGNFNTVKNPAFAPQQQTTGQFDFRQKIQLAVTGKVGDRLNINLNYDTEATFDFENQVKLDFSGKEDDIIKKIELGNVNLPLNSSLISGSQSLFGIKTVLQFGRLTVTSIITQQRGKTTETEIAGGAQNTRFDIQADNYDMNRHYFLSHYFRDNYDAWVANPVIITSPIIINRVEVWVTNRTGAFDNSRDVVGFADLGEVSKRSNPYWTVNPNPFDTFPDDTANSLYAYLTGNGINANKNGLRSSFELQNQLLKDQPITKLQPIAQYQAISYARLLSPSEYTVNPRLGYISLNQTLNNDDVLCVAFEYTLNGRTYKVGEFTTDLPPNPDNPNVLFTKMLKGPSLRPDLPIWDLMMKNIYSLGTFQLQAKDFRLNIIYADDPSGADLNYLPVQNEPQLSALPLVQVLNLDNFNTQQERAPDGNFDFIEGVTVNSAQGRIIFPVLEPFGSYLASKFVNDPTRARYYSFYELYDSTRFAAIQLPQYNKFFLRGNYSGNSNSEISLGQSNIPRGSVRVTANGAPLTENQDFTVDYFAGRVKIINTGLLNSGAVIKVSSESNSLFSVQQKSLLGTRLDYKVNRDFVLGGTVLYLNERPLTPKVNIGEEPISNVIIGVDGTWKKESRFLTKLVDKLPFIETKEISNIAIQGEYARLIPGVQSSLANRGTAYLDDFEGSETPFDLRLGNNWSLASTPQGQFDLFPEGNTFNTLEYGFKRANLAWYTIATTFYLNNAQTPEHITNDDAQLSDHRVRQVGVNEVFPSRQIQQGQPNILATLDLAFYPNERGPYNYTISGLNADGTLNNPRQNWGGIMRKIDQNDFEASNIDYIEVWMMDPYLSNPNPNNSGELYINLGNVSEDILRDNRRAAENGIPRSTDPALQFTDTTVWGRVPRTPVVNFAFDADPAARTRQDVGLDGLSDDGERAVFDTSYLQRVAAAYGTTSQAYQNAINDPSYDNYRYFLSTQVYDPIQASILDRYRRFNKHQGNSPTVEQGGESFATSATNTPDNEDINRDYTLNDIEEYYQYKVDISKSRLIVGQNFVTDSITTPVQLKNGKTEPVTWYQLKIPIREYQKRVGEIIDFKSIRFIRMYMRGFDSSQVLRFGAFQLVRADWRKYLGNLEAGKEAIPGDPEDETKFVVSTVNIEKNSLRVPIPYRVPPGIQREIDFSTPQAIQQNEQSLSVLVCNLNDGDARAVFKNLTTDLRQYSKLRMFIHAEGDVATKDGDVTAFIRLGTDLTNNYYEYEIPLKLTRQGQISDDEIWPLDNEMIIELEEFINTKIQRTNANHPFTAPYFRQLGKAKFTVVGLPDLSQVRVAMLGIRNPKAVPGSIDDGAPKCTEVWFNELRMTGFNNRGGWAANARVQAKLADFANMQLSGSISTVGFGGLDKKLNQRNFDDQYQFDVQSNFELGKFLPKKSGLSIPMFVSYGNTLIRPFYNPLNPDTRLQKEIDESTNPDYINQIQRAADDFTARRSLNFTNIRKSNTNPNAKKRFWRLENFTFTYSFNETYRRNQVLEYYLLQNYKTISGYNYTFTAKPWEPFKSIKSKQLTLIKDFNLFFKPQGWGLRLETDRRYGVTINRNNDLQGIQLAPLYDKMYTMTRYYEFRYDLSRGLKFDYNANVFARIDEPLGEISENTPEKRDSIRQNLLRGGRLMQFDQTARVNYNVPINKLPYMGWVSQSSYTYTATYQWKQAPPAADSLGNTISNSRAQAYNLNFNMVMLYNLIPILKQVNNPGQSKRPSAQKEEKPALSKDKKGKQDAKKEEEKPERKLSPALTYTLKVLMSLKNASGSYTKNEGSSLPGFKPTPQYLGQNMDLAAPGFDFILGSQDAAFRKRAAQNGWLSDDPRITNFAAQTVSENLTGRATLEPFTDFRIELNMSRTRSQSSSVLFRFDTVTNEFIDVNQPNVNGSYSITFNTWKSTFSKELENGNTEVFEEFQRNRVVIAQRLAAESSSGVTGIDSNGFPLGYSRAQQDVLIPAFLAAYGGSDPASIKLSAFPTLPDANWRITYSGLSKLEKIKEYASNVTINHQYSSTYTVNSFQSILTDSANSVNPLTGDAVPQFQIRQISIQERFGPFCGIDVTLVNNVTAKLEYKRDRMLNFSLTNGQLNEQIGREWVIGSGYRTTKLTIPFKINGRRLTMNSDINFRLDFGIRYNVTKIRNIDRPSNDAVQGQRVITLRPTIDYNISEQLMLRIFYDYRRTDPETSNTFPTVIQSGGFSLRYTIQ
ncbi:MAG: cell surface protein SprA [Bacteroidia bacterium]|jgi:cell surface protein SprA|nr:cell surface protein SprA [Bacteroidia bacterium]